MCLVSFSVATINNNLNIRWIELFSVGIFFTSVTPLSYLKNGKPNKRSNKEYRRDEMILNTTLQNAAEITLK